MQSNFSLDAWSEAGHKRLFFANFLRHPLKVGAALPSSTHLIRRILRPIDWNQNNVIVEYGPGLGTVTAQILKRMNPHSVLIAIENNREFVKILRQDFADP